MWLLRIGSKQLCGAASKWLAVVCRCFDVARSSGAALLRSSKHWFVAASKWLEAAVWCCFDLARCKLCGAASKWLAVVCRSGSKQPIGAAPKWLLAVACRCFEVAWSSGVVLLRGS